MKSEDFLGKAKCCYVVIVNALQCLLQCEYLRVKWGFMLLKGIWLDKVNFTFQVLSTMSADIFDWHDWGNMYYWQVEARDTIVHRAAPQNEEQWALKCEYSTLRNLGQMIQERLNTTQVQPPLHPVRQPKETYKQEMTGKQARHLLNWLGLALNPQCSVCRQTGLKNVAQAGGSKQPPLTLMPKPKSQIQPASCKEMNMPSPSGSRDTSKTSLVQAWALAFLPTVERIEEPFSMYVGFHHGDLTHQAGKCF